MAFLSSDVFLSFQGNKIQQHFLRLTAMSDGSNTTAFHRPTLAPSSVC